MKSSTLYTCCRGTVCNLTRHRSLYDGVRRVSGLRRDPAVSTHPTEQQTSTLSQESCAGYLLLQSVRNPHRILARGSESVFKWDVWIGVGSSAENAGSLRNSETRRTPSIIYINPSLRDLGTSRGGFSGFSQGPLTGQGPCYTIAKIDKNKFEIHQNT